jgi:hypothetical protein
MCRCPAQLNKKNECGGSAHLPDDDIPVGSCGKPLNPGQAGMTAPWSSQ